MADVSNEKMYLRILKSMTGLKWVIDRDFYIVFSNCQDEIMYGAHVQQDKRVHCYNVHSRNLRCDPCHLERVFRNGLPEFTEIMCPSAQREKVYIFPIFDEEGTVCMAGVMPRNANTPLRQMVEEALGTKEVLMAFVETAPFAIHAMDNEKKVIIWNKAAEKIFGWKKEEVLGKVHPFHFTSYADEILGNMLQARMGESLKFFETQRINKDGIVLDLRLSNMPLKNSKNVVIGYIEIIEDITERNKVQMALKDSNESYRTIFDAANDAHFVLDAENAGILDVNLKTCEMFGFENREEVLLHNLEDMIPEEHSANIIDFLRRVKTTKIGKTQTFESLAKHTSGRLFWVEVVMKGVIIGGKYRVLAVVRDIMQRKTAEEENKRMQEKLLHADKMAAIGTLASGIAHEINNPNNFILSNAQFLSEVWPDIKNVLTYYVKENGDFFVRKMPYSLAAPKIPKIIDGIAEGAYRIKGIITSLKDFSRQETTFEDKKVDINKVIEAALTMLQNKIKNHTDFFECKLGENIPPVKGNFRQLEQVILNLILNALESLPSRERKVGIVTSYSKQKGKVEIKVSDEGGGMNEEIQKSIFDPFFTTKFDTGGTGLGLFISFTIINKHNGTIECKSKLGEGTSFLVMIPSLEGKEI
ncbi:MAG: PAS domain S-box protein [Pedobacter sp.]